MLMKSLAIALVAAGCVLAAPTSRAVDVQSFIRKDTFNDIKLSPGGEYYAATVPLEDRTVLVVIRRSDNKITAKVGAGKYSHVDEFEWVNPERLVVGLSEKLGSLDMPQSLGELYAVNADGTQNEMLVGQRVMGEGLGTKIQPKKVERVAAFLADDLPSDDKQVIISVMPFSGDPYTRADRMDVYSGRRMPVALAPIRNATFTTDNAGVVRFASGHGTDNISKLYYRKGDDADWQLLNDESTTGRKEWALGFSADNQTAYLEVEQDQGPNAVVALDIASETRNPVLRDDNVDPASIIYRHASSVPVGAVFMDGKPRTAFFDASSPEARLYRSLEAAFRGDAVRITSQTDDGRLALVRVSSDRNPGDFYIFDTVNKKAQHLASRGAWFDPEKMGEMRPVSLTARDGLVLNGYLSLPNGSAGKGLPLVVMPHGGPFGIQDVWGFDAEAQMLASAGYAVLQLNYRGSSGYGKAFTRAGARQWGLAMQDDLTDATRWAIQQGIADSQRVCIYGGSYGGYASLMGVAKEPGLYRCAVGYVGVYDLPTMHTHGDIQQRGSGETYIKEWIGDRAALAGTSPNRLAERIKVPVFLAAGGEDQRAPIEHSKMMEQALRKAGVPVETLYYDTEGHGFYQQTHRAEYYTRLLAFLARHLGGAVASTGGAGSTSAAK